MVATVIALVLVGVLAHALLPTPRRPRRYARGFTYDRGGGGEGVTRVEDMPETSTDGSPDGDGGDS
jgi:hypothetical protein